jgi:hypothetical protein
MPQRHRQWPPKVLDGRVEESGKGKRSERRHADPVPMRAQPGHGQASFDSYADALTWATKKLHAKQ